MELHLLKVEKRNINGWKVSTQWHLKDGQEKVPFFYFLFLLNQFFHVSWSFNVIVRVTEWHQKGTGRNQRELDGRHRPSCTKSVP